MKRIIYISGAIVQHDLEERKAAFEVAAAFCEAWDITNAMNVSGKSRKKQKR